MKTLLLPLALLGATAALAQHEHGAAAKAARPATAQSWTSQPLLLPGRNPRGERAGALLMPRNIAAPSVTVFAPAGPVERLKVEYPVDEQGVRIASATPRIGNYHWVVAREESAEAVKVASAAWYFGNPGDSPKELLKQPKHELEIVPAPLPREHARYKESEKWRFLVRFDGQPLPNQAVLLETEFGSRTTFFTDAVGVATVLFPRDFKPEDKKAEQGGHGPRRAAFVLSTTKEAGGRRYLTAFNHSYAPDADRNRSLVWGAAFGLVGMLAATPLLRRRQGEKKDA